MFIPFSQSDKAFIIRLEKEGYTTEQAMDMLFDFQLELEQDAKEEYDQ